MQDLLKLFPDLTTTPQSSSNIDDILLASSAVAAANASQAVPLQDGTSTATAVPGNGTTTNISGPISSTSPTSAQPADTPPVAALSSGSSTSPVSPSVNPATSGSIKRGGRPHAPRDLPGGGGNRTEI
jgi:hypothetical protein